MEGSGGEVAGDGTLVKKKGSFVCGIILESLRENNRVGCAHGRRVSSGAAASLSFGYVLDMGACFTLGSSNTPFEQHRLQQPRSTTFNYFLNNTSLINSKFNFK